MEARKHYIDNLRSFTILLLFPVHTFMIWNDFDSRFYIWQGENRLLSTLIVLVNPWFMPILFVLAGVSARYALKKRTEKEFIRQRIQKLLIPFVLGMVLLVPFQALYARKYFEGYQGGILEQWKYFFTHFTDLNGYDGAFTPGHLWFILFLFVISMLTLPLFHFLPCEKADAKAEKLSGFGVLLLFVPVWIMYYLGNFSGFSLGKDLALYVIGYYVIGNDEVMKTLEQNIKWLAGMCIVGTVLLVWLYYRYVYYGDWWINFIGWNTILVLLVLAKRWMNKETGITVYLKQASYSIYILHQTILVALAYYVVRYVQFMPAQAVCICAGSFVLTLLAYHMIKGITFVGRRKM